MSNLSPFKCPDSLIELIKVRMIETGQDRTSVALEILNEMPNISVQDRAKLPESGAIYLVWSANELLYIGQSKNLRQRFVSHHRMNKFRETDSRMSWIDFDGSDRAIVEENLIEALKPILNGTHSPAHEGIVSVMIPNELYKAVQQVAIDDGAKIHHISKKVITAPTIVKLVELALSILREKKLMN